MAITDRQMLEEVQYTVIEPPDLGATWPSGLWTLAEVLGYANQRQYRFLKETGIVTSTASITANTASGNRFDLPTDWIETIHASWKQAGVYRPLERTDTWVVDHVKTTWESATGTPNSYMDAEAPTLKIQIAPAPTTSGTIEILYVALSTTLDRSGINLTVPDEFMPYIKWGVLADMLNKVGRGQDVDRAGYAEQRFAEGVALAQMLLGNRQ